MNFIGMWFGLMLVAGGALLAGAPVKVIGGVLMAALGLLIFLGAALDDES